MYKKLILIVSLLLIVNISIFVCAQESIKIGVPAPYTGPVALMGSKMKAGADLAAEEINKQGGLLGKTVELIYGDTESSPEKGVAVFERFATLDKVDAIVGGFHGSVSLATSSVAERYGIPNITVGVVAEQVTERGYKTVFRVDLKSSNFTEFQVGFVEKYLIPKEVDKFACISENTDWGRDMANLVPQALENLDCELVSNDIVELGTNNFYTLLTKLKGAGAEAVFCSLTGSSCYPLITQASELGFPAFLIFAIPEPQFPEAKEMCGEALNNRTLNLGMYAYGNSTISEKAKPFDESYHNKYGEYPSYVAALHYDAMLIYFDAVQRVGTVEKEEILNALHDTSHKYLLVRGDNMKFDEKGNLTPRAFMTQVQDFKTVILWPEEFATSTLQFVEE